MNDQIEFSREDSDRLVRLETTMKSHTEWEQQNQTDSNTTLNEIKALVLAQNGRVKKLETWQSYIMGGLTVIGFLIGILFYK